MEQRKRDEARGDETLKRPDHLAFVRTLPCVCCGDDTSTEAAHVRMKDPRIAKPITGMQIKPDDKFTLPLCGKHHREQHEGSEAEFWKSKQTDPVLLSLAIFAASVDQDAQEAERIIRERF